MKQFLYHVTPKENVQSILQNGLRRKGFAVHLSEKPYSWYTPGLAIFKVRITGLRHEMTTFLPESDEILVWGDIPAERVCLVKANEVIPRKMLQNTYKRAVEVAEDMPTIDAIPVAEIKDYLQKRLDEWEALGDRKFEPANMWGYNFIMACFDDLERRDGGSR